MLRIKVNKEIKKALKHKSIFIDIEGSLTRHTLQEDLPCKPIIKAILKGDNIYIAETTYSPLDMLNKIRWLNESCPINFDGMFWFVPEDSWDMFSTEFYQVPYLVSHTTDNSIDTRYGLIIKGSNPSDIISYIMHNNELDKIAFIHSVNCFVDYAKSQGVTAYNTNDFLY